MHKHLELELERSKLKRCPHKQYHAVPIQILSPQKELHLKATLVQAWDVLECREQTMLEIETQIRM